MKPRVDLARPAGLMLGYVVDRFLGDPARFHPVAGFGQLSGAIERSLYADSRVRGAGFATVMTASAIGLGRLLDRRSTNQLLVTAGATWLVLGGRSLESEARTVAIKLADDDLIGARLQVGRLVGRDTERLSADQIARATVESVAENTSDAVVAPLVAGALFGTSGLFGYRAINTLDAMIGHRNERYVNFGWAAAKIDDIANFPGSRLSALLALAVRPGRARAGWQAWREDASEHPSPNAGVVESAFAGVLGVRLGGPNRYYGQRVDDRPILGRHGRPVEQDDIGAAVRLSRTVGSAAALVAAAVAYSTRTRSA